MVLAPAVAAIDLLLLCFRSAPVSCPKIDKLTAMHGHMADTGTASILELGQSLQLPTEQSGAWQQSSAIMLAMTARLYGRPPSAFQGPPPCCRQGISSVARSVAATCHPADSQNQAFALYCAALHRAYKACISTGTNAALMVSMQ